MRCCCSRTCASSQARRRTTPEFAAALAQLADVYVNDAFGACHRAHASTEGVAHLLPSAAGRLLENEVLTLTKIMQDPTRPLVVIVGGSKVADKIGVIDRFLKIADVLMIGGAMCFPFLSAQGHNVGDSLCEDDDSAHARALLEQALKPGRASVMTPDDLVIGDSLSENAEHRVLHGVEVPPHWMGLDIGPATAARYAREIANAGTVFWNGPMGAFELRPYRGRHAHRGRGDGDRQGPHGSRGRRFGRRARAIRPRARRRPPVDGRRRDACAGGGPDAPRSRRRSKGRVWLRERPDAADRGQLEDVQDRGSRPRSTSRRCCPECRH